MTAIKVASTIALVSFLSYVVSYCRRILASEHDERFIIILEVLLVFVFTSTIMFMMTGKKDIIKAVEKFKLKDLRMIVLSAVSVSVLTILWIRVINSGELSRLQMTRRGLDLAFAIGGGYLLLKEQITLKKIGAFVMLLISAYLLAD